MDEPLVVEVSVFNLEHGKAYLEDGTVGEITTYFDSEGTECTFNEAVVFVAEFPEFYVVVDTRQYNGATIH